MGKHELLSFPNDKQLAQVAAEQWLDCLAAARVVKSFSVAVSGGRIARTFFTVQIDIELSAAAIDSFSPSAGQSVRLSVRQASSS